MIEGHYVVNGDTHDGLVVTQSTQSTHGFAAL